MISLDYFCPLWRSRNRPPAFRSVFSDGASAAAADHSERVGARQGSWFKRALAGSVATELVFRNQFSAFDDVIVDRNLLSSYVPSMDFAGRIDSVLEIYQDVTDLLGELSDARQTRNAAIFGSLAVAYLLLLVLRRRS